MWDVPRLKDIPLGSTKVPSSGFLGLVTSGLSNLERGISFVFRGFCRLRCLMGLKMIPFSACLLIEWREVMKKPLTVRLGIRGGLPRKRPL